MKESSTAFPVKIVAMLAFACAVVVAWLPAAAASLSNVAYGPNPAQRLDVCAPDPAPTLHPAVLLIHGGGWRRGSRSELDEHCGTFTAREIVAIPIDYRLVPRKGPGNTWPAQMQDAQLAMRWVRAHARQFDIDPNRICAEGDSAGGQLAALLDVVGTVEPGDMAALYADTSPRADCVVSISGPTDFVSVEATRPKYAGYLFGLGDRNRIDTLRVAASPALRIAGRPGPALLIHGLDDPLVPFAQAEEFRTRLARAGTNVWLVTHPGGHELQGTTAEQARAVWPLIASFVETFRLEGPPRTEPIDRIALQD